MDGVGVNKLWVGACFDDDGEQTATYLEETIGKHRYRLELRAGGVLAYGVSDGSKPLAGVDSKECMVLLVSGYLRQLELLTGRVRDFLAGVERSTGFVVVTDPDD